MTGNLPPPHFDAPEPRPRSALFRPAPLFSDEDPAAYRAFVDRAFATVKPTDVIEEMWADDIVDHSWEVGRARAAKAGSFAQAYRDEKQKWVQGRAKKSDFLFPQGWAQDPAELERIDKRLVEIGLTREWVRNMVYLRDIDVIERLGALIGIAEDRRNKSLQELERRRARFAQVLRQATNRVLERDFEDVPLQPVAAPLQPGKATATVHANTTLHADLAEQ